MNCPHCQKQIEASGFWDFFNCTHCQASLEVANGKLKLLQAPEEYSENLDSQNESESQTPLEQTLSDQKVKEELPESQEENSYQEQKEPMKTNPGLTIPESVEEALDQPEEEASFSSEDLPSDEEFIEPDELAEKQQESESFAEENSTPTDGKNEKTEEISEDPEDLSSIAEFGNTFGGQKDLFSYEIHISGISSEELRKQVERILQYRRLKLDSAGLISQIQNEKLIIHGLHAVQTMYLVKQLSSLPLNVNWFQKSKL